MGGLNMLPDDPPWYSEGLHFKCTECGQCCTGAPGYTWVSKKEIKAIANYLNLPEKEFAKRFLRKAKGRDALLEDPSNYDCIFLKEKKCQIYPVRPKQCRTFPWWPQTLKTPAHWREAAKMCEGIHPDAPLHSFQAIQEQLNIQTNRSEE
jgi:Fe-S-cluster containining protein